MAARLMRWRRLARLDPMRARPLALALALAFLVPLALAGPSPPADATGVPLGDREVRVFFGPDPTKRNQTVAASSAETLWVAVPMDLPANATAFHAYVNATFANATRVGESLVSGENATAVLGSVLLRHAATAEPAEVGYHFAAFAFTTPAEGEFSYHLTVEAFAEEENGTRAYGEPIIFDGGAPVVVPPAGSPPLPWTWILLAGAVLLGGGVAVGIRRRNERIRMNALHQRRSQALREESLEAQKRKKPEEVQRVQAEIRQAEQVREKRREVQILEAKRADALKTLDLLQKRHESGALSKHQFDQMAAKKKADLARIDAEIAEFERQDGGSAA